MVVQGGVGLGIVASEMDAARFVASGGGGDHEPGDDQHVLHGPAGHVVELQREEVPTPVVDAVGGLAQSGRVAGDAQATP